jgi:hypothetical protein
MKAPKVDKNLPHKDYIREEMKIVKELMRIANFKMDKIIRRQIEMQREAQINNRTESLR